MPLYEYQCADCDNVFERMQKMSDPPPTNCEKCGGKRISKLISQTAFVLKGGGWYTDGYGDKKTKPDSSKPTASTATPTPATKSDAKPAEAPAAKETKSDSSPKKS